MFLFAADMPKCCLLSVIVALALQGTTFPILASESIEFNSVVLDLEDKNNINLGQFSRSGFIMPGTYPLTLKVNHETLAEIRVPFYVSEKDPEMTSACLLPEYVSQLLLTSSSLKDLTWWHEGECLNPDSLPGMKITGDLATSTVYVSIPQAYMEYTAPNWDPPSRWDNGIPALLADYNINANANNSYRKNGNDSYQVNANGVVGVNAGAWRLRGDWQTRLSHQNGRYATTDKNFQWNRFYAYRAVPALNAKLTLGEDYLSSNIFDSFRFTGASLRSDLSMMPPTLRGYAPEVTGIAKTNATVIVSQQGRVLYETQVAPGPFRIQDLSDAILGKLDVTVKEEDGSVQEFQVDTANLPYLTRPGQVQYKLALGQPTDYQHHSQGDNFFTGEFSWGVNNGWSLLGGSLNSENYNAFSAGFGRDLLAFGAITFDVTQSIARLPGQSTLSGGSYRVNYSKRFEEYDSQIQFAGYRFSERDFMSMSEYLNAKQTGIRYGGSKELYTVSLSKNFKDVGISTYFNYNHQTYWDYPNNDYYSVMISKYMDIGSFKNVNLSISANRSIYNGVHDDSAYLSLSLPWGNSGSIGYSINTGHNDTVNKLTYYDRFNDNTSYQVGVGVSNYGASTSTFISHQADVARLSASASYQHGQYSAFGLSASGGLTITADGGGIHRMSNMGGTRMLIDTDGIPDVPIRGQGALVKSNLFGKAIISDMNSYYRSKAQIDLNELPDNVDAQQSAVQATLTEGAVGYRHFEVIAGQKAMTILSLSNGSYPPFGAQVKNAKNQNTGIVGDSGNTYISGISPNEVMTVTWGEDKACEVTFPKQLGSLEQSLLLPCLMVTENSQSSKLAQR